ncbi:stomatin-like [Osmerus eperlanus]|uniref:stomatin-like n=1 Tax=Osmerus eperlanus TaxID=29151 RepID=UPI002E1282E3
MPDRNRVGVDVQDGARSRHLDSEPAEKLHDGGLHICGTILTFLSLLLILATFPVSVWSCVKVVQEYERAVVFRLGRVIKGQAKGPGLFWIIPWLDTIQKVDLRTVSFNIPPQEVLTADWVPLKVDAVMFYRVVEPALWVTQVADANLATHTLAQVTLRATLGTHTLTDAVTQRGKVSHQIEELLSATSERWGVQVERVELRDVSLPPGLQRSMAAEAEAVREARAKLILAEGEVEASRFLREAGLLMSSSPVALELRYLQSVTSVVTDHTSTLVVPIPCDLLGSLLRGTP